MLTHVDEQNRPQMVDVSEKPETLRVAEASGVVRIGALVMRELKNGDIRSKKGPVFATAIVAATLAVKKTHELIPFCHPIMIESIKVHIDAINEEDLEIKCSVSCRGRTGVEMEALTGVHVAALTIHDMCKALDPSITVEHISLSRKSGGKSDYVRGAT